MEISVGYKKTDIGIIPDEWNVQSIRSITKFHKQGYYTKEPYKINGKYFLLRGTDMQCPDIDLSTAPKINASESDYISYQVLEGDFLFVRSGAIGRYGIAKQGLPKSIFGSYLINFRFNNFIIPDFFGYLYQSEISLKQINSITQGGGNLNINAENIKSLLIPLPPLPEQQAIAEVLSDTDKLIQALEKQIAKKRLIKQGVMQKLLTPKEGWEEKKLPEVCWFQEGPGLRNWQFTKSGIKVINVTNLVNGYLDLSNTDRYISMKEFEKMYKHFEIDEGDIVMASSGNSYSKVAVVRKRDLRLVMNTSVIRFKPLKILDYDYLLTFLKSTNFKKQIDLLITGGAQPNFGPAHLKRIYLPIPPKREEQGQIANILSSMDSEIEVLEKKLSKYKSMKQGLMQNLLTGKIRLK